MQQPDDALTVKVVLPERNLRTALRLQGSQKLSDVVTLLCSKFTLAPAEDYALFQAAAGGATRLDSVRLVSSFTLQNMAELILRRFQFRVTILMPHVLPDDLCVDMIEPPDIRVEQLLAHTIQLAARKNSSINYQHHGLYLPLARKPGTPLDANAEAIPMEGIRTLQSYRLRPEDQLIFRDRSQDVPKMERLGKHLQKTAPGNLFVVIESSVHGSSKIYGFAPSTTVGEVAHTFCETNPVTDIQEYGLFVKATGVRMEALHRLSSFPLRTLDTLMFKRLDESDVARLKGEVESDVSPNDVFGTDPSGLPRLLDYGLEVPAVLALLRQELMHHNGLDQQGVFRLGGEERKMVKMQKELNKGQFVQYSTLEEDVFGVAALIKRWFGELPVRIFEVFPLKRLDRAAEGQTQAMAILEEIREPQKSILMWFLYLLVDAATRRSTTLMDCNNLAIVAAPVLTSIPLTNPMEGLIMTQRVTQIVRQALEFYLAKAESGQLANLKAPAAQPIPPPSSSPSTSSSPMPISGDSADSSQFGSPPKGNTVSAPLDDEAATAVANAAIASLNALNERQSYDGRPSVPGTLTPTTMSTTMDRGSSPGGRKETSPWKRVTHADSIGSAIGSVSGLATGSVISTTSRMSATGTATVARASVGTSSGSVDSALPSSVPSSPLIVNLSSANNQNTVPRRSVPNTSSPSTSPRGLSPLSSPRLLSYPAPAPLPPESSYKPSADAISPSAILSTSPYVAPAYPPSYLFQSIDNLIAPAPTPASTSPRKEIMSSTLQQLMSTQEFFPPTESPPASPRPGPVLATSLPPAPLVNVRSVSPRPISSLLLVTAARPPPMGVPVGRTSSQGGDPPAASQLGLLPSPRPGQQPYSPLFVPPRSPPPGPPTYALQVMQDEEPQAYEPQVPCIGDLPPPDLDAPPAPPLSPDRGRLSPTSDLPVPVGVLTISPRGASPRLVPVTSPRAISPGPGNAPRGVSPARDVPLPPSTASRGLSPARDLPTPPVSVPVPAASTSPLQAFLPPAAAFPSSGGSSSGSSIGARDDSPAQLSPRLRTVVVKAPIVGATGSLVAGAPRSMTPSGVKKYPNIPAPALRSASAPNTPLTGSPGVPSPLNPSAEYALLFADDELRPPQPPPSEADLGLV